MEKAYHPKRIAKAVFLIALFAFALPCRAELNFSADARVYVLDYASSELASQDAVKQAGMKAMTKALKYLKKNFMVRKTHMDKEELAKLVKYHFPARILQSKEFSTGRGPTAMARVGIPLDMQHFQEAVRLWAHTGGAYLDTSPGTGMAAAQQGQVVLAQSGGALQVANAAPQSRMLANAPTLTPADGTAPASRPAPAAARQPQPAPATPTLKTVATNTGDAGANPPAPAPATPETAAPPQPPRVEQPVDHAPAAPANRAVAASTTTEQPIAIDPSGPPETTLVLEPPSTASAPSAPAQAQVAAAAPYASASPFMPRIEGKSDTSGEYADLDAPISEGLDAPVQGAVQNKALEEMTSDELVHSAAVLWQDGRFTDPDKALELNEQALVRNPDAAVPHNNKGAALHDLGRYQEAVDEYTKALDYDPLFAQAYNNRGFSRHFLGRYDAAIKDYTKAIEIDDKDAQVYLNRGFAYRELGRTDDMCTDFTTACTLGQCGVIEAARAQQACP